jgi:hypothetical protein
MEAAMRQGRSRLNVLIVSCALAASLAGAAGAASAEEENRIKRDAKQAGHDMKSGIVEFGRGMRDVAKGVGHGAAKVGKEIGHTAKGAPHEVAEDFKHGDKKDTGGKPRIPLADP